MSRILFLSWCYPPMAYPRATQVARLASHVSLRPLEVYCLAPSGQRHNGCSDTSSSVEVTRVPRALPTRLLERVLPARRHRALQEYDVKYLWWRKAAQQIIDRQPSPDDVLVTFGQPMVDHLAGLEIKRRTGIRWVAHFSDPWADNPFDPGARRWLESEQAVLLSADMAIFTSKETVELVYAKYPSSWRSKVKVLPHSYEPSLYPDLNTKNDFVTVRYLGNLFAGRGPEALVQALIHLRDSSPGLIEQIRFEFVGEVAPQHRNHPLLAELPPNCVKFMPKVTYRQSLALAASSDLLLNIDAPADVSVFLPSKLIDYIGAGRPIFGITPRGAAASLIEELGGWVADPARPSEIAEQLKNALADVQQQGRVIWGNPDVRARYEAGAVAKRFEQMIRELDAGQRLMNS